MKARMISFGSMWDRLMVAAFSLMAWAANAQNATNPIQDIQTKAKSVDITKVQAKTDTIFGLSAQMVVGFGALLGIAFLVGGLIGIRKAGKDENSREGMKGPVISLVVGGALLVVTVVGGLIAGVWSQLLT